jgi:hypothetical protein
MYYGHAAAGPQDEKTAVWDASFQGVWHLAEGYSTSGVSTKIRRRMSGMGR